MIHALPGMGADHRMFPPPWDSLPDWRAHDWPAYAGERTLADLATRLIATCCIRPGDVLIGASLGGMVACEISKQIPLRAVFLVGSALHRREVSRLLQSLAPLIDYVPINALRLSAGSIPADLARMFEQADADFLRAMCKAILDWPGGSGADVPFFRLHGRHDLVIPEPEAVDYLLDGGHLISMTHAPLCVAFVQEKLATA